MIVVRGVPIYWGVETEPKDRSFVTRATLHEVLPPFRQSIWAFRIRVSWGRWLHIGIFRFDREARRYDLGVDPDEIGTWGRKANGDEEETFGADPGAIEVR